MGEGSTIMRRCWGGTTTALMTMTMITRTVMATATMMKDAAEGKKDARYTAIDDLGEAGPIRAPFLTQGVDAGDGDSCYGDERVALVVRQRLDRGEIVTLATPDLFTNEIMGAPEPEQSVGAIPGNAVVAQRLLGSGAGAEPGRRLGVVTSGIADVAPTGEKSLTDFMSTGVKLGLLELGVAFLFYAWARGRRHGRVVTEPAPVTIAGSAFVEAVGSLLERQGDVPRAAEVVREGQCRELARRLE